MPVIFELTAMQFKPAGRFYNKLFNFYPVICMMRLFFLLLIILVAGCKNSGVSEKQAVADTVYTEAPDTVLVWYTDAEKMLMKRDTAITENRISADAIINGLNEKYPEIKLAYLKLSGDTVYTSVPDAEYLGEQMGDAGAAAWFADAVINLTSVPGINYVSFRMDLHSHAASGVIGRDKYSNWRRE